MAITIARATTASSPHTAANTKSMSGLFSVSSGLGDALSESVGANVEKWLLVSVSETTCEAEIEREGTKNEEELDKAK